MRVCDYNKTQFCAKPLVKSNIKVFNKALNKFQDREATLFEFEMNDYDMNLLDELAKKWNGSIYVKSIKNFVFRQYEKNPAILDKHKVYGLTTQKSNFDRLNLENILGIAGTAKYPDALEITELEVKESVRSSNKSRKCKHVGSAILDSLKNLFIKKNDIRLMPIPEEREFYIKNGYVEHPADSSFLVLKKEHNRE